MSHLKSDRCTYNIFRANILIYFKEAREKLKKKENKGRKEEKGEKRGIIKTKYLFIYNVL